MVSNLLNQYIVGPHGLLHKAVTQFQICKCGSSKPRYKEPNDDHVLKLMKININTEINWMKKYVMMI